MRARAKLKTKPRSKMGSKSKLRLSSRVKIKPATKSRMNVKIRTKSKAKNQANIKSTAKTRMTKIKTGTKSKLNTKSKPKLKSRNQVSAIPKGYRTITPYLIIKGAEKAINFYKKVFNAKELMRMPMPDGKIAHAEIIIGDSKIMLSDEAPKMNAKAPGSFGGSPVGIHLYMEGVDAVLKKAVKAGAKLERPAADMFYGDRIGSIIDPFGHRWAVSTHIEDVTPKEMKKRMATMAKTK